LDNVENVYKALFIKLYKQVQTVNSFKEQLT